MGRTERFPGWQFPDPNSTDYYDAQEMAKTGVPCPQCGALVPLAYGQYHVDFHNAPWKPGFTPRPTPTAPPAPPAPTDPALGGAPVASPEPPTDPALG